MSRLVLHHSWLPLPGDKVVDLYWSSDCHICDRRTPSLRDAIVNGEASYAVWAISF
ncbi:MAG: hypothetical protein RM368_33480 [Nostoc sp. DedSLP03]|nr:hypothetical protein [Nostoc sp. DedSLP03]